MPRRMLLAALLVLGAGPALALPPPDVKIRVGANHHIGDASFVARFGRAPRVHESEPCVVMRTVRDWLASRPVTRPALEARRAQIIGYLSDYVAKGTTPRTRTSRGGRRCSSTTRGRSARSGT